MSDKKRLSPAEKKRLIERLEYMLFVQGITQEKAAKTLDLSPTTVSLWINKLPGWRERLKDNRELQNVDKSKFSDSLDGFMIWLSKQDKDQYEALQPAYRQFIEIH